MIRRPPRSTRTDTLFPYTTLCRSFLDRVARAALGADEQDHAALLRDARDEVHRVAEQRHGLFEVDDVDLAAGAEDVRRHLGVPVAGLVAEMQAGFQHLRSEVRRVGIECVSQFRSRWSP